MVPGPRHHDPDFMKRSVTKAEVDPTRHLIGTAAGWGGNPDKDAVYLKHHAAKNDGKTIYKLNVRNVPSTLLVGQPLQCRRIL